MKKIVLIITIIISLISCRRQTCLTNETDSPKKPQLEKLVFQFIHTFTSPSMLIWDAQNCDIIFQNISSHFKVYNKNDIIAENSIWDYNFIPQSLYCKIDSSTVVFIRDSLSLCPKDFEDNMPQIEDGMITRIMSVYDDGTFLSVEFNTPNENQASLSYYILDIAVQNQPDSISKEYLKCIRDYYEQEATKVQFLSPLVERRKEIDRFLNK